MDFDEESKSDFFFLNFFFFFFFIFFSYFILFIFSLLHLFIFVSFFISSLFCWERGEEGLQQKLYAILSDWIKIQ